MLCEHKMQHCRAKRILTLPWSWSEGLWINSRPRQRITTHTNRQLRHSMMACKLSFGRSIYTFNLQYNDSYHNADLCIARGVLGVACGALEVQSLLVSLSKPVSLNSMLGNRSEIVSPPCIVAASAWSLVRSASVYNQTLLWRSFAESDQTEADWVRNAIDMLESMWNQYANNQSFKTRNWHHLPWSGTAFAQAKHNITWLVDLNYQIIWELVDSKQGDLKGAHVTCIRFNRSQIRTCLCSLFIFHSSDLVSGQHGCSLLLKEIAPPTTRRLLRSLWEIDRGNLLVTCSEYILDVDSRLLVQTGSFADFQDIWSV